MAEWQLRLHEIRDEWAASLPAEAATTWKRGAAYVRHSSARSLGGDAPDSQLRHVLTLLANKGVYVPENGIFFDVQSATDTVGRAAFRQLFEMALADKFQVVGCFVNERLFRNLEQSIQAKRQFRLHGIELEYLGRFEGDRRNPTAWQIDVMQDMTAEFHARNTGYYVGTHMETLSRAGRVITSAPEVFAVAERAPSFMGRRGSVIRWEVKQPLGRIMQEGCRRYLDGASFAELAEWAKTTELEGFTPAGRQMDKRWWYYSLKNPKFAGYQVPTTYTGFKPGKESPPRPRRNADSELVPCDLPALWTLEDHRAIVALGRKRWGGNKWRRTYRSYLLSGIAYDARCGCRVWISDGNLRNGGYRMGCGSLEEGKVHGASFRADIAAAELDALIGGLSFDDPALVEAIAQELKSLTAEERRSDDRFSPSPQVIKLRQAISALEGVDAQEVRDDLRRRLAGLEALDEERRLASTQPVVDFRHAIAQLRRWSEVWGEADTETKNKLLAEAGVSVVIAPLEDRHGAPAHLIRISAQNESFRLALGALLPAPNGTLGAQQSCSRSNVRIDVPLATAISSVRCSAIDNRDLLIPLPQIAKPSRRTPPSADAPAAAARVHKPSAVLPDGMITLSEFARRAHAHRDTVHGWVAEGRISAIQVPHGSRPRWLIREDELDKVWAAPVPLPARAGKDGKVSVHEFARMVGAAPVTVLQWVKSGAVPARRKRSRGQVRFRIDPCEASRLADRRVHRAA